MKRTLGKILCIFLIMLTLFNFIYASNSYADLADTMNENNQNALDTLTSGIGGLVDGVAGILASPFRLLGVAIGSISQIVAGRIASVGAESGEGDIILTLEDIFFHNVNGKIPIIDINFFKDRDGKDNIIMKLKNNIAGWYYAIRNLAIIISLLVLIYIGIRMAISTVAEDKAKYKNMLTDWIVGFITIFLLHYIIIATIYVNEALVGALKPSGDEGIFGANYFRDIVTIATMATTPFITGFAATIVYFFMTGLIFMYLFTYIKRMLTVAFLIIIAPIITVTYSIDKIGDGKSQALNTWLKEFMYNVLIQPFHCIIYLVFSSILVDLLLDPSNFGGAVLAIIIMLFMRQAEGIIRSIFGFGNAKHLGNAIASGALLVSSMKAASSSLEKIKGEKDKPSNSGKSGSTSSSSGADKKPNLKDTSNTGGQGGSTQATSGANSRSQSNTSSENTRTQSSGADGRTSDTERGSTSDRQSSSTSNDTIGPVAVPSLIGDDITESNSREYNTERVKEAESKFKKVMGGYVKSGAKIVEVAAGIGLGGAMGGSVSDMISGVNFASAGVNAIKVGGQKIITKAKNNPISKNSRINKKRDSVIDAYNNLANEKGWGKDRMIDETERVLNIKDTSRIKDEKLREYAETVQNLRIEYEEEYQAPNDMVLDTIQKIQSGNIQRGDGTRYTRRANQNPTPEVNSNSEANSSPRTSTAPRTTSTPRTAPNPRTNSNSRTTQNTRQNQNGKTKRKSKTRPIDRGTRRNNNKNNNRRT